VERITIETWSREGYLSPEILELHVGQNSEALRVKVIIVLCDNVCIRIK